MTNTNFTRSNTILYSGYKIRCKGVEEGAKAEEYIIKSPEDPDITLCKHQLKVVIFKHPEEKKITEIYRTYILIFSTKSISMPLFMTLMRNK